MGGLRFPFFFWRPWMWMEGERCVRRRGWGRDFAPMLIAIRPMAPSGGAAEQPDRGRPRTSLEFGGVLGAIFTPIAKSPPLGTLASLPPHPTRSPLKYWARSDSVTLPTYGTIIYSFIWIRWKSLQCSGNVSANLSSYPGFPTSVVQRRPRQLLRAPTRFIDFPWSCLGYSPPQHCWKEQDVVIKA